MTILTHVYTFLTTFLADTTGYNDFFRSGMAYLGAGIACIAPAMACIGQGFAAGKAAEAVGRQPEASGKITVTMIIGAAIAETGALYGFIMAIMLLAK